jgi:flagellar protein FlaI
MPDYLKDAIEKAKKAKRPKDTTPSANVFSNQPTTAQMDQKIETVQAATTEPAPFATNAPAQAVEYAPEELDPEEEVRERTASQIPGKTVEKSGDALIVQYPDRELLEYRVPIPKPTLGEKTIINIIKEAATQLISISPYRIRDPEQRRNVYYQRIMEILRNSPELKISPTRFEFYAESVVREMVGYGVLDPLLSDDQIEEIMVIGPQKPVYVFHRKYDMMTTNIEFYADKEIQNVINKIARDVGRRVDFSTPLLDARLPDGSRVNATIPPASVDDSSITIRKFRKDPYTITDLIRLNTLDAQTAAFLWLCVEGLNTKPANILIAGGTGSGKTTLLNCLTSLVPERERVITIEDTAELNLPLEHWIRLEARPPGIEGSGELALDILTKNSLRMRPDRIIVGEVRHAEASTMFTAMNTGHDGVMGTIHANTAEETLVRITNPPMSVPVAMLAGLDFIIVENRLHDRQKGTIRRLTEIAEVRGVLEGKPYTQPLFIWNAQADKIEYVSTDPAKKARSKDIHYYEKLSGLTGRSISDIEREIDTRAQFLSRLAKQDIADIRVVREQTLSFLRTEQ